MAIRTLCLALLSASLADAFQRPQSAARAPRAPQLVEQQALPATVVEPLAGYAEFWNGLLFRPAIEAGLVPEFLLHWGHGLAMGTVLCSMGVIGSWMGWQIRGGNGGESNALTLGETIRDTHPKIMGGALFFFALGGQGGLVLNAVQGNAVLGSAHASTGLEALGLLAVEAALPLAFEKGKPLRDAHAYLGSAIMVLLFAHMAAGIQLGMSF